MESFAQSQGGRLIMAAHAVFLATIAIYLFNANLYVWGIGLPIGVTLAFVGVGLSMHDHEGESMLAITVLPCALWGLMYLAGELDWRDTSWPAYLMGIGAVWALYRAAVPPAGDTA